MTNKRAFKFSTLLIIVFITILVVIGCKKRPTGIEASLEVIDTQPSEIVVDINDFAGNSYKSGNHSFKNYAGMVFFYTAEVKDGNIVIERYNASTGEKNGSYDGYPQKYSAVASGEQFVLTHQNPKSKLGYNITLDGEVYLVTGGTATFDETGLTIAFTEGGKTRTVRFEKQ